MMENGANRTDTWIQWGVLLLAILGGVWQIGGRLGMIEQQMKDNAALFDAQSNRIGRLEDEVLQLTRRVK